MGQQELTTGMEALPAAALKRVSLAKVLLALYRAYKLQGWVTSGQTTSGLGVQPHPSADNWIKALLIKALFTRARPSFSHLVPPIRKYIESS